MAGNTGEHGAAGQVLRVVSSSSALPSRNTWRYRAKSPPHKDLLLDYVNKRTGENVKFQTDFLTKIKGAFTLICMAVIGVLLVLKLKGLISNPISWLIVACALFFICCGGMTHNLLHHPALIGTTNTKTGVEYKFVSTEVLSFISNSEGASTCWKVSQLLSSVTHANPSAIHGRVLCAGVLRAGEVEVRCGMTVVGSGADCGDTCA